MSLLSDLSDYVSTTFRSNWETRNGQVVPVPTDLKLGNDAVVFERATALYADLTASTLMVDTLGWQRAAEIYKAFLFCSAKVIRDEGGSITSYDGDRVMGIFVGDKQSTSAVRCAMKINWAVQEIINPALRKQYSDNSLSVSQVVGIDTSEIRAARTGVRGDNDIVWVGRAANYAAKLTEIKQAERTWITKSVYDRVDAEVKFNGNPKSHMWKQYSWTEHDGSAIFGSTWWWSFS
jgi:class 3 adenylate cyclase